MSCLVGAVRALESFVKVALLQLARERERCAPSKHHITLQAQSISGRHGEWAGGEANPQVHSGFFAARCMVTVIAEIDHHIP